MRFLPTRIHGIIDYLEGALLLVLAGVADGSLRVMCLVVGVAILGMSAMTQYELGIIKVVPMPVHLVLDGGAGIALIAAAAANWGTTLSVVVAIIGIATIGGALVTETRAGESMRGNAAR